MRRGAALIALVVAAAVVTGCGGESEATGQSAPSAMIAPDPPPQVGAVRLPDAAQGGRELALRADDGGLLLVFFGYTHCPDVCPTTMATLRTALGDLPAEQAARVTPAFVTVDPGRDTAAVLEQYVASFFGRFHALRTDDAAALAAAEHAFGAAHEIVGDTIREDYEVTHSAAVYAVDADGAIRGIWPYGATPAAIASDLSTLLDART